MIGADVYGVDPWTIPERKLDLDLLAQTESIFALSNGHIGLRGNLDEGEPSGRSGTYLNGFHETRPLPYAEAGYGDPESGETIINVTNGKVLRLLVDDEPFDLRYGTLEHHERTLDLRSGTLRREVRWLSPAGQGVIVRSTRLVSFVQRAVAAIEYEVEAYNGDARIVVQSELVANEPMPEPEATNDPRAAAALRKPLQGEFHGHHKLRAGLVHMTRASQLRLSAGMDHVVGGPREIVTQTESEKDLARVTFTTDLHDGERMRIVKFLAYGWSSRRSLPALRDQTDAALAAAMHTGWDELVRSQRAYLDEFWAGADVELDGDPALQQAMRFALFSVLQSAARAEGRAIPAKGLTGRGYDGHSFWDMETYTLPMLTYVAPAAARDALLWRHSTLDMARARARELRIGGAAFPWRTISGKECSGYWPAGTAAFHINADIADAVRRYIAATGDAEFEAGEAIELLVETARLWRSLGHHDVVGNFRIDGVTGPDEYSAIADNNVYTNLMAARNMRTAADLVRATTASARPSWASTRRRSPPGATRPTRWSSRSTRSSASPSSASCSPTTATGTSSTRRPSTTRCCCTTRTTRCTPARSSSRPTSSSRCTPAATTSAPSRRRATSTTTRRSPCATRRCRRACRRSSRRRSATSTSPTTTSTRRPSSTCATSRSTRRTASTSPRWRARGSSRSPASAACATPATRCGSRRACPPRSRG